MPTYDEDSRFRADFNRLTSSQKAPFLAAVAKFVADLKTGTLREGLRVKRVQGYSGVWEMTWADDGRATFVYGPSLRPGDPHDVWRRVGSHGIFEDP